MNYNNMQKACIVVDAHCDTLTALQQQSRDLGGLSTQGHTDLYRLKTGGVNVQFFAIFVHPIYGETRGVERTLDIIDLFYQQLAKYQHQMALVKSRKDIDLAVEQGKIAAVLAIEGGEALGGKINMLNIYYLLGVRCLTLTWNSRNSIADGVGERQTKGGLTNFGVKVVQEMNRLGMIIDISHLSEFGFWDVLETSSQPVIATHSNCTALCAHPRNLTDQQITALAEKGGVVGLTLVPQFIAKEKPTLEDLLDHIEHVAHITGNTEHIGIGSDFDGMDTTLPEFPDCSKLPLLTEGLMRRGYHKEDINNILGGNFLRVFSQVVG